MKLPTLEKMLKLEDTEVVDLSSSNLGVLKFMNTANKWSEVISIPEIRK